MRLLILLILVASLSGCAYARFNVRESVGPELHCSFLRVAYYFSLDCNDENGEAE